MLTRLRTRTRLRAAAVSAALVVYAFPLMLGALAEVSHTAYHLVGEIREHQGIAAATTPATSPSRFEHSHGGVTHSHDAATDALLLTVQRADDNSGPGQVPALKLADHVPGTEGPSGLFGALADTPVLDSTPIRWHPGSEPLLPPPRA